MKSISSLGLPFPAEPIAAETGLALIDRAFRPIAMDDGAASILSAISNDGRPARQCREPQAAFSDNLPTAVLEQMRKVGAPAAGSKEMRFTAANYRYSVRARLLQSEEATIPGPLFILCLEREQDASDALRELSLTCRLTDREKETLSAIAIGLTNKEIAQRMKISPSTVKAFLRLIKIKTGARNRADMVARLLDPQDRSGRYHADVGGAL